MVPVAPRLAHTWRAWLPTALTLALAVAAAALAPTTTAAALAQGLDALPPAQRSVTVSADALAGTAPQARVDALVGGVLTDLTGTAGHRQLLFRPVAGGIGGTLALAARDDLAGAVRLTAGRLPAGCAPRRCEVVQLGPGPAVTAPPALGLVVVGRADRTDPRLLSGTFDPGDDVPVLLAGDVAGASRLDALTSFGRTVGWVAPLRADRITSLGVDRWATAVGQATQRLFRDGPSLVLTSPVDVVRDQQARAAASAGRFGLLTAAAAVLLLGAAVLGGLALRADHTAWLTALRHRGARPGQLAALTGAEVAAVAGSGLVAGLLLGAVTAAVLTGTAGVPVTAGVLDALRTGAPAAVVTSLLGAGLTAVALRGRVGRGAVAGTALAAAVGALLVAARGGVRAGAGTDPLPALLPALVLLTGGLALAAAWPALAAGAHRLLPRGAPAPRLGLSAAAGRPVRPAAAAGLLAAALAATVFAVGYRATLERGAADQAAFAVPTQALLTPRPGGPLPGDVVGPDELRRLLGPGAVTYGVLTRWSWTRSR